MSFNKSLFMVLGALAISSVMAYDESFEVGTAAGDPLALAGWGGYGTYSNTPNDRVLSAGMPLTTNHNFHLAVDGWVTNTIDGAENNQDAQLDMLVKVSKPDEPLDGMSDGEAKFAMAIDQDGTLKYYTGSTWASLGDTAYEENQWIRVAVVYDNTGKRCKVSVDGNACTTSAGYKTATSSETNGPWYPTLDQSMTKISSLKVVGTTALDDIKVTYVANSSYTPEYKDAEGHDIVVAKGDVNVPLSWFDKNNVATNVVTATDGSGMTIADKYQTGMDPNGGEKFEMKSMTMTQGETVTATVTVPVCRPPSGHIRIQTSTDKSSWDAGTAVTAGAESAQVDLKSGNVTYFRMVLGE